MIREAFVRGAENPDVVVSSAGDCRHRVELKATFKVTRTLASRNGLFILKWSSKAK